jgi:branched-chain amino acid transport system substrate-binding protein
VIVILVQGDDMINCLKQAVQFGLEKKVHLAGAQQELEPLMGLPPEARIGTWVFEWYWNQPNVPHVNEFNAAIKAKTGHMPTARTWFGFAAAHACALGANGAKSVDAVKIAKVLQGFKLPPEVALMPGVPYFRAGQNQLIPNQYVGHAQGKGPGGPEDLFHVDEVVKVGVAAGTLEESECKMEWPS